MNETHTKKLIESFPKLFRGVTDPNSCMQEGFNIGDGWFDLVFKLSTDIEYIAKNTITDDKAELWPEVLQVKEKFGLLRFYVNCRLISIWDQIDKLINAAEASSAITCENCGRLGERRHDVWIRTLCGSCEVLYQKRNND